ncbi:MAG: hypothetical protein IT205_00390 [Fimbriimonadaceae bacterium]|nr:hypothetical protein [Fimbriimonadaceae bacterium]
MRQSGRNEVMGKRKAVAIVLKSLVAFSAICVAGKLYFDRVSEELKHNQLRTGSQIVSEAYSGKALDLSSNPVARKLVRIAEDYGEVQSFDIVEAGAVPYKDVATFIISVRRQQGFTTERVTLRGQKTAEVKVMSIHREKSTPEN